MRPAQPPSEVIDRVAELSGEIIGLAAGLATREVNVIAAAADARNRLRRVQGNRRCDSVPDWPALRQVLRVLLEQALELLEET